MKHSVKKSNYCCSKTKNYILFWFSGFNGLAGLYMFIGSLMYRGLYIFSPACGGRVYVVSSNPLPWSPDVSMPVYDILEPYLSRIGRSIARDIVNPSDINKLFSVHSDTAIATKPDVTMEKNIALQVSSFSSPVLLDGFSSTILLLVVGYPDMCSHPPLVSLSLTPKPLRCDLNAGDPMTIHQKERANA